MPAPSLLQRAANAVRKILIVTGTDRLVARGLLWSRLRPDNVHYASPTFREAKLRGIRFRLDLSDYMQWSAYFRVERDLRDKLYNLAAAGDVAIDVGTNIGEVLLGLAERVGSQGRAVGFEPNPKTYEMCVRNMSLNPRLTAEIHPVALGHCEGELSLGRPCASNSGGDRVVPKANGTIAVPVMTLDRFVMKAELERVDLIKIDVEGFELRVLSGAEKTIARFRPALFVEVSDDNLLAQGATASDLIGWLHQHGYTVEHAVTGELITPDQDLDACFFDVICR